MIISGVLGQVMNILDRYIDLNEHVEVVLTDRKNYRVGVLLRIFMVSIFSSHILISDYQFPYHWKMISLLSKHILFRLLSS